MNTGWGYDAYHHAEMLLKARGRRFGDVWWVNNNAADDLGGGRYDDEPCQKIATAIGKAGAGTDDYIFVIDCWQQDTFPITVNKTKVHIIGLAGPMGQSQKMKPTGDTAIFVTNADGQYSEIAGFSLSGGATHGCIELAQAVGFWLHHIDFGFDTVGGTPQDGVKFIGSNCQEARIEWCRFMGTGGDAMGYLTDHGIRGPNNILMDNLCIQNNTFLGLPGEAMHLEYAFGVQLLENVIALPSDTEGKGITLGVNCKGCVIDKNHANYGKTAMTANPYLDLAAAGKNHWLVNYRAGVTILPA